MQNLKQFLMLAIVVVLLLSGGCSSVEPLFSQRDNTPSFSFAVAADPRSAQDTWRKALAEIRDQSVNPSPTFDRAEMVLVVGDIDPLEERYRDFEEIFTETAKAPIFLPVVGNHDIYDRAYMLDAVLPDADYVIRRDDQYVNYFADWQNVRIIAVDGYSDFGVGGVINDTGRAWVEEVIESTPEDIDHIFVAFHEPAFPRYRHLYDSFNSDSDARDAFWHMLVANKDRVQAVFVGHTHTYSRMRVRDPAGEAANDLKAFPDEAGGIYQIDVGAAGNGSANTLVLVQIDGDDVAYRVLQSGWRDDDPFSVIDEWQIEAAAETLAVGGR